MKKDSVALLDEAARVLAEHPELKIEIGAHTDNSGNIVKNTHLSQRRADAIREHLVRKGIARARMRSVGYGPTRPVGDNQTADGRAENRRVEIQLVP
jgi:outer membrane protein OmpA-like peptidoglycan-associated protein